MPTSQYTMSAHYTMSPYCPEPQIPCTYPNDPLDMLLDNPFTLTHGYLTEARHTDVPENATFNQAIGTFFAIKKFIETDVDNLPEGVTIVYTSTVNHIAAAIFQDLPERIESQWNELIGAVKFDYLGEATSDQWAQFFGQYNLVSS